MATKSNVNTVICESQSKLADPSIATNKCHTKRKVSWDINQKDQVTEKQQTCQAPVAMVAKCHQSQKSLRAGSPDFANKRSRRWPPLQCSSPAASAPPVPGAPPGPPANAGDRGRDRVEGACALSPPRTGGRVDHGGAEDNFGFENYMDNIYEWNHMLEMKHHVKNFLAKQPLVSEKNRAVVVNWLAKVNRSFEYYYETYFLTVNILDRFLATTPISLECLHLLAITAFMLASKVIEVGHPRINELLKLNAGVYSRQHVLQMEKIVLNKLKFSVSAPTVVIFFEYYLHERHTWKNLTARDLRPVGYKLLEFCILHYDLSQYRPSVLAMAAFVITQELAEGGRWQVGAETAQVLGHNLAEIRECVARVRLAMADQDSIAGEPRVNWRVAR